MGSFNVTCCVTKTPITPGEECVLITFNRDVEMFSFLDSQSSLFGDVDEFYFGQYDDYGNIRGCEHKRIQNDELKLSVDSVRGFFFSKEAWEFGKSLLNDEEYNRYNEYIEKHLSFLSIIHEKRDKFEENLESLKIAFSLRTFCLLNNFNMFDVSFENIYGGQSYNIKEKEQFNTLRVGRMAKFKKEEEEEESNNT